MPCFSAIPVELIWLLPIGTFKPHTSGHRHCVTEARHFRRVCFAQPTYDVTQHCTSHCRLAEIRGS